MDRRSFLVAVLGLGAFGAAATRSEAAPLGRAIDLPVGEERAARGAAPDGTPIEEAYHRPGHYPGRGRRRRPRRRPRVVCRTFRTRDGRLVRRCRRVW